MTDVYVSFTGIVFVPLASSPVTGHCTEEFGSVLLIPSNQVFMHIDKIPFSRLKSHVSLSFCSYDKHFKPQTSLWPFTGLTSGGRITFHNLLVTLGLIQTRLLMDTYARRAQCCLSQPVAHQDPKDFYCQVEKPLREV